MTGPLIEAHTIETASISHQNTFAFCPLAAAQPEPSHRLYTSSLTAPKFLQTAIETCLIKLKIESVPSLPLSSPRPSPSH
jgi:hypothetical protein